MTWRLRKTVVLVGMMGAGKTAVGTQLARMLQVPFRDSDDEIVKAANMTIPEIFARDGEGFFRQKESQVISRLLSEEPSVLSTGGGAYLSEANRKAIEASGVAVWLRADVELLWSRVRHRTNRPLLRTENPYETLRTLYAGREPVYALAQLTVDSEAGLSIDATAQRVVEALSTRADVLEKI